MPRCIEVQTQRDMWIIRVTLRITSALIYLVQLFIEYVIAFKWRIARSDTLSTRYVFCIPASQRFVFDESLSQMWDIIY